MAKETIDLYSEMQNLNRAAIKHIAGIMKGSLHTNYSSFYIPFPTLP